MIRKKSKSIVQKRLDLLNLSRDIIIKHGWNDFLFEKIINKTKINPSELIVLYPDGYKGMLKLSLNYLNFELEKKCNQYNLLNLPIHQRIRKIILTKIKLINKNKKFFERTFYYLLIPGNYNLLRLQLYKSVDLIWYIAGDNSTDFNFYTKRISLLAVYISVILYYFSNDNMVETKKKLDKSLLIVSKIPKVKNKFQFCSKNLPFFLKLFKV